MKFVVVLFVLAVAVEGRSRRAPECKGSCNDDNAKACCDSEKRCCGSKKNELTCPDNYDSKNCPSDGLKCFYDSDCRKNQKCCGTREYGCFQNINGQCPYKPTAKPVSNCKPRGDCSNPNHVCCAIPDGGTGCCVDVVEEKPDKETESKGTEEGKKDTDENGKETESKGTDEGKKDTDGDEKKTDSKETDEDKKDTGGETSEKEHLIKPGERGCIAPGGDGTCKFDVTSKKWIQKGGECSFTSGPDSN